MGARMREMKASWDSSSGANPRIFREGGRRVLRSWGDGAGRC